MKYLLLFPLLFTACSSKPDNRLFICVNPQMAIQGVEIQASDPNVKITGNALHITTESGAKITLPLSLCMVVERAE